MDAGAPERLVRVDVPHPGHRALVEQRRLDRCAAPVETLREIPGPVRASERLRSHLLGEIPVHLGRFEQEPGAEAADVTVGNSRSVV